MNGWRTTLLRRWPGWLFIVTGIVSRAIGQPLDWSGDVTIFGSPQNESRPALAISPAGDVLRAVCVCADSVLCSKVSLDHGQSWGSSNEYVTDMAAPVLVASADHQYAYILAWNSENGERRLFRFAPSENNWQGASQTIVAGDRQRPVVHAAFVNDWFFQPDDPFLHLCWVERDVEPGHVRIEYISSHDRGQSFETVHEIATTAVSSDTAGVALAVTWESDAERIVVATTMDRTGSLPDEVRVFTSSDQGATWSAGLAVDAASVAQSEPAMSGFGNTCLLAYVRRSADHLHTDVWLTFSLDGGLSFASPFLVAGEPGDEHAPRLVIDNSGQTFCLTYLAENGSVDSATVMLLSGSLAEPWVVNGPISVSNPGSALLNDAPAIAGSLDGLAAVWTSRFVLGDTDVRFDASWRGSSIGPHPYRAIQADYVHSYPNPCNGRTEIVLHLSQNRNVRVVVTDVLGRVVLNRFLGPYCPGEHAIGLDLSAMTSGFYFARFDGVDVAPERILLIR